MERYINFETVKLLKQIGFREPCRRCYDNKGDVAIEYMRPSSPFRYDNKECYLCPTQAEVTEWLRLKHKIFIEVNVSIDLNGNYHYSYSVLDIRCKYIRKGYTYFDWRYEDAMEEAIKFVINNCLLILIYGRTNNRDIRETGQSC